MQLIVNFKKCNYVTLSRFFGALAGNNWVLTDQGPKLVSELENQPCNIRADGKLVPIQGFQKVGKREMVKLYSYRGQSILCTDDVQVVTYNNKQDLDKKQIQIKDLQQRIIEPVKRHKNGKPIVHQRGSKFYIGDNSFRNSDEIDQNAYDLGWLLGWMVGDGTYRHGKFASVSFFVKDLGDEAKSHAWRLYNIMNRLQETNYFQPRIPKGPCYFDVSGGRYSIHSVKIQKLCRNFIESGSKNILASVEQQTYGFHKGFFQGYFAADGYITLNRFSFCVSLSNINLHNLQVAQRILQRYGIMSSIVDHYKEGKKLIKNKISYIQAGYFLNIHSRSIVQFSKLFGFGCSKKSNRLIFQLNLKQQSLKYHRNHFTTEFKECVQVGQLDAYVLKDQSQIIEVNGILINIHN